MIADTERWRTSGMTIVSFKVLVYIFIRTIVVRDKIEKEYCYKCSKKIFELLNLLI